jgi:F-type H+-transporting ATPase subunit b
VHAAVLHLQGSTLIFPAEAETEHTVKVGEESDPGPIVPEMKELAWGAGSFVVFALLMRFVLFPRVKRGMDARYNSIRGSHESADQLRISARAEVTDYESQLASIRAEAARAVEAARQTVESERQARLAEVNVRLNEQRAAALAEADAERTAAQGQIRAAVSDVAGRAGELATGQRPDPGVVDRVVGEVMAR